ncbi:hypothetical protein L3Q82_021026 [Scortum barcoo]|uniref:Uncharacterized protein n=1 Tax=Scortum barcoo TaxID=214431 RepID=A0ACB8X445_9TELE|nr:hypothetical protein L3Q82_021026 [Scortum barcoo]
MKAAQQEVKHCVKEAKDSYRRKVEQKLRENNMREVWEGVRTITGLNTKTRAVGGTMERANELNDFFNRFNQPLAPHPPPSPQPSPLSPPHTSPRHHNTTLLLPHINTIFATHHHRPASSDPRCNTPRIACSFAYQPGVGVEDAILYLLHRAHSHLDKGSGTVRILFLDFSSAFNTIQPTLLRDKLSRMGVDPQLMDWISDYLTGRPQYVGLKDITSDTVVSSTGAPQGTVLAPLLFTLYTSDFCYNSELCHIHIQKKYADDTAIVG